MLVPEIALTPVFSRRLRMHFGDRVAIFHSSLSRGERFDEWTRVRNGEARDRHRHAFGSLRTNQKSRAGHRRRRTRINLSPTGFASLQRPRHRDRARAKRICRRDSGIGHAIARIVSQRQHRQVSIPPTAQSAGQSADGGCRNHRHARSVCASPEAEDFFRRTACRRSRRRTERASSRSFY